MAAKVPLVVRVDQDLKDLVVSKYPGNTVTESVIAALRAATQERGNTTKESSNVTMTIPEDVVRKDHLDKIVKDIKLEIGSIKDNVDIVLNLIKE